MKPTMTAPEAPANPELRAAMEAADRLAQEQ